MVNGVQGKSNFHKVEAVFSAVIYLFELTMNGQNGAVFYLLYVGKYQRGMCVCVCNNMEVRGKK